jgi:hypothetical protein
LQQGGIVTKGKKSKTTQQTRAKSVYHRSCTTAKEEKKRAKDVTREGAKLQQGRGSESSKRGFTWCVVCLLKETAQLLVELLVGTLPSPMLPTISVG